MRTIIATITIMALCLTLTGCGAGSSDTGPFGGVWNGSWSDPLHPVYTSAVQLAVGKSGTITGQITQTPNAPGPAPLFATGDGTVTDSGNLDFTYYYNTEPAGTLHHLVGTVVRTDNTLTLTGTVDGQATSITLTR